MLKHATVIGSGPNGLAAAIRLAQAGIQVTVLERAQTLGGACSTESLTLAGFRHDRGASVFPMGVLSPFLRSLDLNLPWREPDAPCAHPLDDGTAVMLEHSVEATAANLDPEDRAAYLGLFAWVAPHFAEMVGDLLGPVAHIPEHPLWLARFGLPALLPATALIKMRFKGVRARALFAGMAAHSVQALEAPASAAVGLALTCCGHSGGWPIVEGGAQTITDALARRLLALGGTIDAGHEATTLPDGLVLADLTPRQLLRLGGQRLPASYRKQLEAFSYGAGAFKVDYALSEPIPWTAAACKRAATVHLGGSFEEVADSERTFQSSKPFVLLVQPSLFDPTRAPAGRHTAWAYCHVPFGSVEDHLPALEAQIERFAPGFAGCVLARAVSPPAALEAWNPNLVGGDLSGGVMTPKQMLFRPTPSLYRTGAEGVFLCGSSTPPGGGVHGMAGFHAAEAALKRANRG